MTKPTNAVDLLKYCRSVNREIDSLMATREQLYKYKPSATEAKRDIAEAYLNIKIDNLLETHSEAEEIISVVENLNHRALLRYYYILGFSWEEASEKLYISIRQAYNWRNTAFEIITAHYNQKGGD